MKNDNVGLLTRNGQVIVPLTGVSVEGDITGRSARVTVRQRFENRESMALEVIYKFPLPEGAAVCGFRALVGDRAIVGHVEERNKAFEEYDKAMEDGHGAYLLDEERPNVFTLSAGNLNPRTAAIIEVSYVVQLDGTGREVRFFLPTTISPRYVPKAAPDEDGIPVNEMVNPPFALEVPYGFKMELTVKGATAVESVSSPSHTVAIHFEGDAVRVRLTGETAAMDRDFILNIGYKERYASRCLAWKGGEHTFAQLDLALTPDEVTAKGGPSEIVFVLDCSGSMQGSSIAQAKKALEVFLGGLSTGVAFNIYRFGNAFQKLFGQSTGYDHNSVERAWSWLAGTDANLGGTEVMGPLQDIYDSGSGGGRSIVLITDGEIGNEEEVAALVGRHTDTTRLFVVGIGHGPNEYFIKRLARTTRGAAELVAPGERIEPPVLRLFEKVSGTAVTELTVNWPRKADQAPQRAGAWANSVVTVFARLPGSVEPLATLTVTGRVGERTSSWMVPVVTVGGPESPIAMMWARERIRELEEGKTEEAGSRQTGRKKGRIGSAIVELAKAYGLMSRETSYVAIEERTDTEKTTGRAELRRIPVMLTHDWHAVDLVRHLRADSLSAPMSALSFIRKSASAAPLWNEAQDDDVAAFDVPSKAEKAILHAMPLGSALGSEDIRRVLTSGRSLCKHLSPSNEALVVSLLALQRPEGGFKYDAAVAKQCGVEDIPLKMAGTKMHCEGACDYLLVMWTAIVLELLSQRMASGESLWRPLVRKSEWWLKGEVAKATPTVDGEKLTDWARTFVAGLKVT